MRILKCDLCGKEFDEFDTQENFGLHYSDIGYGSKFDGETMDVDMCCGCFDKMINEYIIPRTHKSKSNTTQLVNNYPPKSKWNYDMISCPLNTKLYLLSEDCSPILPQQVFVGTIVYNGAIITRGQCFQGDPDYFYRSKIIAWQPYNES